jgi:taurine dioxygenase
MSMTVTRLGRALGADVSGVELHQPLDAGEVAGLRQALNQHLVVRVRGQRLDAPALKRVGEYFGPLFVHPNLVAQGDFPEVITITKEPDATNVVGGEWHTDTTCMEYPPLGAILHAIEVPTLGGDTLFANQYLAYEALSPAMQTLLTDVRAVHNDTRVAGPKVALNVRRSVATREQNWTKIETTHPVVHTHPETGRRALFVNIAYTRRFANMTEQESAPLMNFLLAHAVRPEFSYRFQWQPGDVLFWDNRALKHIALNDYPGERREMIRVQVAGQHQPSLQPLAPLAAAQ